MNDSKRNSRIARLVAAIVVVATTAGTFAALGGAGLTHSAIVRAQYPPVPKRIAIVNASASRNGVVTLRVVITGWKMYPGLVGSRLNKKDGGHWTIVVDRRCNNVSANRSSGATRALRKGVHGIYAQLANNNGSRLTPNVKSNTVRVRIVRTLKKRFYRAAPICARVPPATTASSID